MAGRGFITCDDACGWLRNACGCLLRSCSELLALSAQTLNAGKVVSDNGEGVRGVVRVRLNVAVGAQSFSQALKIADEPQGFIEELGDVLLREFLRCCVVSYYVCINACRQGRLSVEEAQRFRNCAM
jgi:hypothetical protein